MHDRKHRHSWIKHLDFAIMDILAIEIAYYVSIFYRITDELSYKNTEDVYKEVALFLILLTLLELACTTNYKNILKRKPVEELLSTVRHMVVISFGMILYMFLIRHEFSYSRFVYLVTFGLGFVLTYVFRQVWKFLFRKIFAKVNVGKTSLIIVTTKDEATKVVSSFKKRIDTLYSLRGIILLDGGTVGEEIDGIKIVSTRKDAIEYICREWVDEVFISIPESVDELAQELVDECIVMGVTVHKRISSKYDRTKAVRYVQQLADYTVLTNSVNGASYGQILVKRVIDIIGSLFGLLITFILIIIIGPIIYIKSPGPIFFKQERVGRNGKRFKIYKFRSMYLDAEERKKELMALNKVKDGMMFKMENDPRIIGGENGKGIGNFIRNTSLDEFPQFLNVLKGEMSLVGTRPPTVDEWEKYKLHHRKRMAIKPGLTGMWQISGRSDITDFEEVVRLDTEYITNWSLRLDIVILFKTVGVVLFKKGSY